MIDRFKIKEDIFFNSHLINILLSLAFGYCSISADIGNFDKISVNIENEGAIGSKSREFSSIRNESLNNHGFFYNCLLLECSFLNSVKLKTHLRVLNDEMSSLDDYRFFFEPEITLNYTVNNFKTTFRGGYINDFTLGSGLTVKDLPNSGGLVEIRWDGWTGSTGFFAKGYGFNEDLIWVKLHPPVIPLELAALGINTQGTEAFGSFPASSQYVSGYLLPNVEIKMPWGTLYSEYGFKADYRKNVKDIIEESSKYANAGLIGLKAENTWKRISFNGCVEIRAYEKGFIPLTGINYGSRFSRFWEEEDSKANWVDFFDSRETSYWGYLRINLDLRAFREWHIFLDDELLYFCSKQKEVVVYPYFNGNDDLEGAVVKYNPSTNFYRAGFRYKFFRDVAVEVALSNKLLNLRGLHGSFYSQWGQRFIATKCPYGEARLRWQF